MAEKRKIGDKTSVPLATYYVHSKSDKFKRPHRRIVAIHGMPPAWNKDAMLNAFPDAPKYRNLKFTTGNTRPFSFAYIQFSHRKDAQEFINRYHGMVVVSLGREYTIQAESAMNYIRLATPRRIENDPDYIGFLKKFRSSNNGQFIISDGNTFAQEFVERERPSATRFGQGSYAALLRPPDDGISDGTVYDDSPTPPPVGASDLLNQV